MIYFVINRKVKRKGIINKDIFIKIYICVDGKYNILKKCILRKFAKKRSREFCKNIGANDKQSSLEGCDNYGYIRRFKNEENGIY